MLLVRGRARQPSIFESEGIASLSPSVAIIVCGTLFGLLWWRQTHTRNATSVDAAWAGAIGLLGLTCAALGTGAPLQRGLAAAIVGAWSGRLTWHLLVHRVFGHPHEDGRYRAMRERFGPRANAFLFVFYQAQAAAALTFALPFWFLADHGATTLAPAQIAGLALAGAGVAGEAVADRQLERHRRDPQQRGRTCRSGLWACSRHPNYFCEWLTWCGIALVAAPAAGWYAVIQPVVMYLLVRHVSGVPWTELQAVKSRGDDYRHYQATTSAFFPWWPHREGPR
jgi:steroid 5-alpha reductase family enzyme